MLTVLMCFTGSFLVRKPQRSYFESGNPGNGEMFKMPRCRDKFVSSDRFCEVSRLVTRNLSRRCLRRPLIGGPLDAVASFLYVKAIRLVGFGTRLEVLPVSPPLQGAKLRTSSLFTLEGENPWWNNPGTPFDPTFLHRVGH